MDPKERWLRQQAEVLESIREHVGPALDVLNDPDLRRARLDTSRMLAERDAAMAAMPSADARRSLVEAARFFDSDAFRAQRDGIMRAYEEARKHLSPAGIAASQRIAARRVAADEGNLEREAERLRSGGATGLLDEAARLASGPEVRDTLGALDEEALARLDREESRDEGDSDPVRPLSPVPEAAEKATLLGLSNDDLLRLNRQALRVSVPLNVVLAFLMATNPASLLLVTLLSVVTGLTILLQWSQTELAARGHTPPDDR